MKTTRSKPCKSADTSFSMPSQLEHWFREFFSKKFLVNNLSSNLEYATMSFQSPNVKRSQSTDRINTLRKRSSHSPQFRKLEPQFVIGCSKCGSSVIPKIQFTYHASPPKLISRREREEKPQKDESITLTPLNYEDRQLMRETVYSNSVAEEFVKQEERKRVAVRRAEYANKAKENKRGMSASKTTAHTTPQKAPKTSKKKPKPAAKPIEPVRLSKISYNLTTSEQLEKYKQTLINKPVRQSSPNSRRGPALWETPRTEYEMTEEMRSRGQVTGRQEGHDRKDSGFVGLTYRTSEDPKSTERGRLTDRTHVEAAMQTEGTAQMEALQKLSNPRILKALNFLGSFVQYLDERRPPGR